MLAQHTSQKALMRKLQKVAAFQLQQHAAVLHVGTPEPCEQKKHLEQTAPRHLFSIPESRKVTTVQHFDTIQFLWNRKSDDCYTVWRHRASKVMPVQHFGTPEPCKQKRPPRNNLIQRADFLAWKAEKWRQFTTLTRSYLLGTPKMTTVTRFWRPRTSKVRTILHFGNPGPCGKTKHPETIRSKEPIFKPGKQKTDDSSTLWHNPISLEPQQWRHLHVLKT